LETQAPLNGLVVLDLTRVLAGPYCTMLLAELGARVIKIERPGVGDDSRQFGPFMGGKSAYFMSLNREKESIALDLKDQEDRSLFDGLLAQADVLVENYAPGVMERLGYGWDVLHRRYPRLVMASISGFGQTGPYASYPAYDLIVQGMGGVMSITGHPDQPPTRVGTSVGDITAALFAANGIQAALLKRTQTQKGSRVDVSMLDCQVALLENAIARCLSTGQAPTPLGARHPSITPFDTFRSSDGYLTIAAGNDDLFARLCEVLDLSAVASMDMYATNEARTKHVDSLKALMEAKLVQKTTEEWVDLLRAAGIPAGPIQDVKEVLQDPQIAARGMLVTADDPEAGEITMPGNPIQLNDVPTSSQRRPAPTLDGDRSRILKDFGLSEPTKSRGS